MKYLKVINTPSYIFENNQITGNAKHNQINQPIYAGPTVCLFTDGNHSDIDYAGKHILIGDDCPVKFTWKFGYNQNNQPCIIVNFSKIDKTNPDTNKCILCLESNFRNTSGGSNNTKPCANVNGYIKRYSNNRALSVFNNPGGDALIESFDGITYYKLKTLQTNTDYYIRIIMPPRYMRRRANYYGQGPFAEYIVSIPDSKYEVNINVRPTFRKANDSDAQTYPFRWNEIPVEDYKNVKFILNDNYIEY